MKGREGWIAFGVVLGIWALAMVGISGLESEPDAKLPVMVVFAPTTTDAEALRAIVVGGGRPLRPVIGDAVWLFQDEDGTVAQRLRDSGAWAVMAPPLGITPAGCAGLGVGPRPALPEAMGR